ncbi:MAG: aminotransferase class V-fold PLP-dependent enzyme, partial [Bacteroidetes bacterium]|nr:aminotransferase class V-fold PLP-dependent enzyme [Bacteroidota bacterium]
MAWNEAILDAIDERTALVSLAHVHWADGTLFDLPAIRQRATEAGALLVIDGTQSVGALPFDIQEIQPDALICAAYKWLMGPYTTGLAY